MYRRQYHVLNSIKKKLVAECAKRIGIKTVKVEEKYLRYFVDVDFLKQRVL